VTEPFFDVAEATTDRAVFARTGAVTGMEIAILGGTGDIGEGLALRWGRDTDHAVTVGSREAERAREAAAA